MRARKNGESHAVMVAYTSMHYNFGRVHQTLRVHTDSAKVGILSGSILAGVVGAIVVRVGTRSSGRKVAAH